MRTGCQHKKLDPACAGVVEFRVKMDSAENQQPGGAPAKSNHMWVCITLMVLILAGAAVTWKIVDTAERAGGEVADKVGKVLGPRFVDISIVQTEGGEELYEFTTYKKDVNSVKLVEHTHLMSTWKVLYSQQFEAKYGIRISETAQPGGALDVGYDVIVTSIEPKGKPIIRKDDGMWHEPDGEDLARIVNEVKEEAKKTALEDRAAVQVAEQRLREFLQYKYAGKDARIFRRN